MTRAYVALHARIAARLTVITCGMSVLGIGTTTLVGYGVGVVGLFQWSALAVGMAPNTALGFVMTGLGLTVLGSSNRVWRCS